MRFLGSSEFGQSESYWQSLLEKMTRFGLVVVIGKDENKQPLGNYEDRKAESEMIKVGRFVGWNVCRVFCSCVILLVFRQIPLLGPHSNSYDAGLQAKSGPLGLARPPGLAPSPAMTPIARMRRQIYLAELMKSCWWTTETWCWEAIFGGLFRKREDMLSCLGNLEIERVSKDG